GEVDHEGKWFSNRGEWRNWNREISVFPGQYLGIAPLTLPQLQDAVRDNNPVRVVAGGHAFNTSMDTGGNAADRKGALITLDELIPPLGEFSAVAAADAVTDYGLVDGTHVFRVSAGMRLREFTAKAW